MIIGGETSKGGRAINQDALFLSWDSRVFVIADGAGGHNAGEVASNMVVEGIAKHIREGQIPESGRQADIQGYFADLIQQINAKVFEKSTTSQKCFQMATTLIMVFIEPKESCAYVFNVGDSRAYVIKNDEIIQITEDHTYVNELIKRGEMSKDSILEHPLHHVITRAIGGQNTVKFDMHKVMYEAGDIFILCTDGLYNVVFDQEIYRIVTDNEDMQTACEKLIEAANMKKGSDNITAICVKL